MAPRLTRLLLEHGISHFRAHFSSNSCFLSLQLNAAPPTNSWITLNRKIPTRCLSLSVIKNLPFLSFRPLYTMWLPRIRERFGRFFKNGPPCRLNRPGYRDAAYLNKPVKCLGNRLSHPMPRRAKICLLSALNQCRHRGQLQPRGHLPVSRRRSI